MLSVLKTIDLFAGAGGFTIASEIAGGYETIAFCEIDKYARKVLAKNWPDVPCFEDVTKLTADDIDGPIDVITGGFPCQDLSSSGRGAGLGEGTRSGLFRHMLRLACEIRKKQGRLPYIIFENVPRLLSGPSESSGQWFGEFLWALAEIGYDAEWFCLSAAAIGAPHKRERVCVVAYANETPIQRGSISSRVHQEYGNSDSATCQWKEWGGGSPEICRMDDGIPSRSHRLGMMGNAIVPHGFALVMKVLYDFHFDIDPTLNSV